MMVKSSPYSENVGLLMKDLDRATTHLEAINRKAQGASKQELDALMGVLHDVNSTLDPRFWEDKKLAPEGMHDKIEKALNEVQALKRSHPEKDRAGQRNVDQAITSLSLALKEALDDFDKNLRDLKKYKIGQKVEKSGESKRS